jgi:hypothetical protein
MNFNSVGGTMQNIYDRHGMLIFPNPLQKSIRESQDVIVMNECFCQNKHSLIDKKAIFGNFPGILLKVNQKKVTGLMALSPVYGDKSRISIDIELIDKEVLELSCPKCDEQLAVFSHCECGADLLCLFLTEELSFNEAVAICSRVNCFNAQIKSSSEIIAQMMNL